MFGAVYLLWIVRVVNGGTIADCFKLSQFLDQLSVGDLPHRFFERIVVA
jgi:hypothetical protein